LATDLASDSDRLLEAEPGAAKKAVGMYRQPKWPCYEGIVEMIIEHGI